MLIADRLTKISPSQTIAISTKARALKAAGRDVISLSAGEPDFDTPQQRKRCRDPRHRGGRDEIHRRGRHAAAAPGGGGQVQARQRARLRAGRNHRLDRRQAGHLQRHARDAGPGRRGDHPDARAGSATRTSWRWPTARRCSCRAGRTTGSSCGAEDLEAAITPRTKWFMLNSPCNPTGAAYSAEDLRPICDVLLRHPDVWVFTDDIYEKLAYDGFRPATIVEVEPRLRDRTLTMNGCSKAYAMTGWRIGFAGAPRGADQGDGQACRAIKHQQPAASARRRRWRR